MIARTLCDSHAIPETQEATALIARLVLRGSSCDERSRYSRLHGRLVDTVALCTLVTVVALVAALKDKFGRVVMPRKRTSPKSPEPHLLDQKALDR
jgi:hypothetical protein